MELVHRVAEALRVSVPRLGQERLATHMIIVKARLAKTKERVTAPTLLSRAPVSVDGKGRHVKRTMHARYRPVKMVRHVQITEVDTSVNVPVNGWVLRAIRGTLVMEILVVSMALVM